MQAASRRPRLRPCAPIGGMRWAASPTSAMRFWPKRPHGLDRERKDAAARLDRDLAEDRMRALLDLVVERGVVERGDPLGLGGLDHADEARPFAGQRHQRERPALGVEFGRGVVVRPRMREIEGQRGLRIGAAVALDAGRGAAERTPPVGADDEAGGDAAAALERDGHAGVVGLDRAGFVLDPRERRKRLRARIERGHADAGSRYCGRTRRARSRTRRSAPPARGRAARSRRRSASPGAARPAPRSRPRPRASPARSRNRPAARWCDGPGPAAARSARSRCRPPPTRSRRSARPGRRPRSPLRRLMALP